MNQFKRYGFQLKDPGRDPEEQGVRHGVGVPAKFTETADRLLLKALFRFVGIFCFWCMLAVLPVAVCVRLGWVNEMVLSLLTSAWVVVIFISHVGFFFEMAVDASGKNWFTRSAVMLWIYFFGSFLLATLWYLIKLSFGIDGN